MTGAGTPEDQIEKDKNAYRNGTNEIPGFTHMTSGTSDWLFPNCLEIPEEPRSVQLNERCLSFHSRTNKIEDSV